MDGRWISCVVFVENVGLCFVKDTNRGVCARGGGVGVCIVCFDHAIVVGVKGDS